MNLQDVTTQLLFTTVPIWVEQIDGGQQSGTAFFFGIAVDGREDSTIPFLLTNLHVARSARRVLVEFAQRAGDVPDPTKSVKVEIDGPAFTRYNDTTLDLVTFPVASVLNQLEQAQRPVFFRSVSADLIPDAKTWAELSAIEEITFIGYPSGLYDQRNQTPIVRRGITASPPWNDFGGEPSFLIDAGVFPGSSGSPVFLLNRGSYASAQGIVLGARLHFLGVLTQAFIHGNQTQAQHFLGLGKVLKSTRVKEFAAKVVLELTSVKGTL